jgi:uncharacterized membrane protein
MEPHTKLTIENLLKTNPDTMVSLYAYSTKPTVPEKLLAVGYWTKYTDQVWCVFRVKARDVQAIADDPFVDRVSIIREK